MSISDLQKLPVTKPDNLNQICALLNKKVIEGANNCMKEKSEEVDLRTCSKKDSYVFTDESNSSKILTRETITKGVNLVTRMVSEEILSKPNITSYSFRS